MSYLLIDSLGGGLVIEPPDPVGPATWPSTLPPTFYSDQYSETEPGTVLEYAPEIGPPQVRRRSTATPAVISGTMLLDQAQLATFKGFVRQDTAGGALPFGGFTHPSDQSPIPAARFKAGSITYSVAQQALPYIQVSFSLYILP